MTFLVYLFLIFQNIYGVDMGSLDIESIHQTSIQLFENHVKEKENIQQQFEDTEWVRLIDNAFWNFVSAIINPVSIYAIGVFLVSLYIKY